MDRPTAFVRGVPAAFSAAVTSVPIDPPLDPVVAADQHGQYVAALETSGYEIVWVPTDDESPDSPFVEDAIVVIGERALVTRPGHPSRRGEVEGVADVVGSMLPIHRVQEPATIDGGDVLVAGRTVLVGISQRTNRAGVAAVAAIAEPQGFRVRPAPVNAVLHLKSGLSAIDDSTVLWHPASCERGAVDGFGIVEVPGDDPEAANVVRLANGSILVSAAHDVTAGLVSDRGFDVVRVDVSEFGRADGGLTCLSVRVR